MCRGPGIEMRLKNRDQPPPGKRLPCRRQCGGQLRRVMRVIIHHLDPTELAQALEPPANTMKLTQRLGGGALW